MSGRPRGFEEREVLGKAMQVFWERGYEATGLTELTRAMGIGRQSLYDAFGDKQSLFQRALGHYLDQSMAEVREALEPFESPAHRIRVWLDHAARGLCVGSGPPKGCFAMNTVIERCPQDVEVTQLLRQHHGRMTDLITETLTEAQALGEMNAEGEPSVLATIVLSFAAGLVVRSKLDLPPSAAESAVDLFMDGLGLQESQEIRAAE